MQQEKEKPEACKATRPFEGTLLQAFFTQVLLYLATSCIDDFGASGWAVIIAGIPFWVVVVFLKFRNPHSLSRLTQLFIRWGLIPIVILSFHSLYPLASSLHATWRNYERQPVKQGP
jgi:hypothetical protein